MSITHIDPHDPRLCEFFPKTGPSSCPIIREMILPIYEDRSVSLVALDSDNIGILALYVTDGGFTRGSIAVAPDCPLEQVSQLMDASARTVDIWLLPEECLSHSMEAGWRQIERGEYLVYGELQRSEAESGLTVYAAGTASVSVIRSLVKDDQVPFSAGHGDLFREWLAAETLIVTADSPQCPASIAAACLSPYPAICYLFTLPEYRGHGLANLVLSRLGAEIIAAGYKAPYAMTSDRNVTHYLKSGFEAHSGWRMWSR